ncbi:MAG: hypothetical protein HOP19_18990 [Acidobacteria bacterium]|nr:hypothetical protein [Acidobacteriota bacterium]
MIIALAGRRIDAPDTNPPRFPVANVALVKVRIAEFMQSHGVTGLVCAASCGADLLALEVAGERQLRRRVVLPFNHQLFRATSVIDRGGDWGKRYDRIIAEVVAEDDLIEYAHDPNDSATWLVGNHDILKHAQALADETRSYLAALIVWEGNSRGADDVSGHLKAEAEARGLGIAKVLTL